MPDVTKVFGTNPAPNPAPEPAPLSRPMPTVDLTRTPTMHTGGLVPKDGVYQLKAGERVLVGDSSESDEDTKNAAKGSVNLQRAFSRVNEALIKLADGNSIKRAVTVPHVEGEGPSAHMQAVGSALAQAGGLTKNLIAATHSIHDADGGKTVAYPAARLRETTIVKNDANAQIAINACRSLIQKVHSLIGDTPEVKSAKHILGLIAETGGEGMTVLDFMVAMIGISGPMIRAVARAHSEHKHGGAFHPKLTAPRP